MGRDQRTDRLREKLKRGRAPLLARVHDPRGPAAVRPLGRELGREHALVLDEVLRQAFDEALAISNSNGEGIVLAGVGGYGRRAVALGADLDLRLLTRELGSAERIAEALLYPLWDAGITVGHQVVTVDDLIASARQDLTAATSLLDWRFVAGDRALSDDLLTRARAGIFSMSQLPDFLGRLDGAATARHKRYGGSVYLLEPDVKNGAGALRDVDVAWWAARARWHVGEFAELVRLGVLIPRQLHAVEDARELLWRIRNVLHGRANRRSDRLRFDEQEALAPTLGYLLPSTSEDAEQHVCRDDSSLVVDTPTTEHRDAAAMLEAVERMMSDYYRAARTISRFRDLLLARAMPVLKRRRPSQHDLANGVQLFDGESTLTDLNLLRTDPPVALRVVAAAVASSVPIRGRARNAIIDVCGDTAWSARLREYPESAELFSQLVTSCVATRLKRGTAMRELHDLGLLVAMVPEFAPVVGRVHHDTYHVYTVDVHSVAAVDRLAEIIRGDIVLDEEQGDRWAGSLACRVAADVSRTRVLFFATLLHDVGKAIGRRDHSERGAEVSRDILRRLGFDEQETSAACRLIRHHLTMYLTATRRDLDDPATAKEVAELVGDQEGLASLYLLTVADLSTTSPTSMTSWKARMLDELYIATDRHFREGLRPERAVDEWRSVVVRAACGRGNAARIERFLDIMPSRYALANPPEDVLAHAGVLERFEKGSGHATVACVGAQVDAGAEVDVGVVQLCVVAEDRRGLLADIAAALTASRLVVHAAQIYSGVVGGGSPRNVAVDLFWVERVGGGSVTPIIDRLAEDLEDVLGERLTAQDLAERGGRRRRREREGPRVETKVVVDPRASPNHTVVEVFTRDRPGLLFLLANIIAEQELSISIAKIATEGTRVVDVFYVTDLAGHKLDGGARAAIRDVLVRELEVPRDAPSGSTLRG